MALIDIRELTPTLRLGLWRMENDTPNDMTPRQRESHAVGQLLKAMTADEGLSIGHEDSGKPFLQDASLSRVHSMEISVSHTRGYAALLLSEQKAVGVDIEYISDRVERISSRFIHPEEHTEGTLQKLLLWSAKETVYKLFSACRLQFFDMRLRSFAPQVMYVENCKQKIVVEVHYEVSHDYVLTYAAGCN